MVIDGSRPIATVANELDINPAHSVWVNKYRDAHPIEEDPTPAERIQFRNSKPRTGNSE